MMESSKEISNVAAVINSYDAYEWYLRLGPLSNADQKYFHNRLPTWNDFVKHPDYDAFWKRQGFAPWLNRVTVPTLNVAGWWDQEDFYGPVRIYKTLEKNDPRHLNYLVAGPWNHGGWSHGEGSKLGKIDFESPTSQYFREKVQAAFFAYYLKDKGKLEQPEALTFETGANKWTAYDHWPPRQAGERNLYFHNDGKLSFEAPAADGDREFDSYVSDPAHPVPYRPRPIEATYYPRGSGWPAWLVEDQRFAHMRPDVLSWETEPLENDLVVTGDITAHVFASTSGSDSDWIVKLIDVYPEPYSKAPKMSGYQLMIANDVLRGRFRNSFERPEPIKPGQVNEYTIDLHGNNHRFLKGHRVMVQVQSTWFPVIDRNPQTFVANIFKAKESDYQPATQRVFRSKRYGSHVTVPVIAQ
jgi:putative CocE/NonD family hydrolase